MKKCLLRFFAGLSLCTFLFFQPSNAQIKGDPAFGGVATQLDVQKTSSTLSPDLKKLSTGFLAPKTKIAQSLGKPSPGVDYFDKYMQIKGDKVVVDITAKEDISTAK